ncbi:MAG: SAM-dependent methyltransferase [Hyperthermus sp.]|nr:MAG: SAM-dependent methyltransferase [Hyperthermus sp.]
MYTVPSVPWVPTREEVLSVILSLLNLKPGDVFYDIGCGDGRVAVGVARNFTGVRVKCIEAKEELVYKAKANAASAGVRIDVINADFFNYWLGDANVIYMYLLTSVNHKLKPKFEEELRPGTLILSLDFPIPGWNPLAQVELPRSWQRTIYIYVKGYSDYHSTPSATHLLKAVMEGVKRLNTAQLPPTERERLLRFTSSGGKPG